MSYAAPSLRPRQRDQVQRVAGRYACLSVTRLPGDEGGIGEKSLMGKRRSGHPRKLQCDCKCCPISHQIS